MDLRILVAGVILLMSGIKAQNGDFTKICDFCQMDDLLDCSLAQMIQVNMTVNCKLPDKVCNLGLDQSFGDFDNLTLQEINMEWLCLLNDDSVASTTLTDISPSVPVVRERFEKTTEGTFTTNPSIPQNTTQTKAEGTFVVTSSTVPIITGRTDGFEYLKTTTEGTFVEHTIVDSLDYQGDQPTEIIRTFRSNSGPDDIANEQPPPDELTTCFVCNSSSELACLNKIDKLKITQCPKPSGCITMYTNGNVIRDCGSSIPPEDVPLCHKPDNTTCDYCPDAKCNKISWPQCHQCNSKDDPNCALCAHPENLPLAICPNHDDKCLVRITKDGDTVRECTSSSTKCLDGGVCSICEGPLCNMRVFPANRRKCIQCQDCDDEQDPTSALPCAQYNPSEECFMYVTAKSKMIRGCVSNAKEMLECQKNVPKCIKCGGANGCNSAPLMKNASLSCIKCKTEDDSSCAWAQPSASVVKCEKKVLYYLQETCMMDFDPETKSAVRDCSFDNGVCIPEDSSCLTCSGDGCNRAGLRLQNCIQCSSDHPEQEKCSSAAEGIPTTKCAKEGQIYETRGCYSMTKGNITTRGCVAELSEEDLKLCKAKETTNCNVCTEDGCNNKLAPSRGSRIDQIAALAVICVIFIII